MVVSEEIKKFRIRSGSEFMIDDVSSPNPLSVFAIFPRKTNTFVTMYCVHVNWRERGKTKGWHGK